MEATNQHVRLGLALGSGAARGWAHIGVLRALEEMDLRPDVIVGASVGSLVAAAFAVNKLDQLETWARGLDRMDVLKLLDTSFSGGGVMQGNRLMGAIGEQIGDVDIDTLETDYAAVAADLVTGQEVWLTRGSLLQAVRASSGLPGLFAPVWHDHRWLIDGGVVNPVPVSLCRALGAEFVIGVNLNGHLNKKTALRGRGAMPNRSPDQNPESSAAGWTSPERWAELFGGLLSVVRGSDKNREPGLFDVITASVNIMQDRITRSRMVGDPPMVALNPNLGHFELMDFHRADEAIDIGRDAVCRARDEFDELKRARAARVELVRQRG
ncbi:MAG: patatin-like phospholipase RssA [Chromatiales bacterium]